MKLINDVRVVLRPIKRLANKIEKKCVELPFRFKSPAIGSPDWLIKAEVIYGGMVTNVARTRVSPNDPRSKSELEIGGMTGGDRMLHHQYAKVYASYLQPFRSGGAKALAEFGILKGTGLAIWCDLFPESRVIGLDIDPNHFEGNEEDLRQRGAFKRNKPEIYEYDQLLDGIAPLGKILNGQTLDIVIDDGLHSLDSILKTWRSVKPYLSNRFVYFIEDFSGLLDLCGSEFAGFDCHTEGLMTVVSAGLGKAHHKQANGQ